jgi:superfamily I DNA/RNA helicase
MPYISPELWKPKGISVLEPNAWTALRRQTNTCVVAGPGAGKSEFLAQRAAYLLETGLCPAPKRILAISFKSDAAENLADRVRQRCDPDRASLFSSMTFDSFTKSLVDRFRIAVPEFWRPDKGYEISFPNRNTVQAFLTEARLSAPVPEWQNGIAGLSIGDFEPKTVGSVALPNRPAHPTGPTGFAVARWWEQHLRARRGCRLTFVLINRLAELLIRTNPELIRALRATYKYVFVDEFQDTTYAQYGFLLSAFRDSDVVVTAVGDSKQRIMVWAGARSDAFERFEKDFAASSVPLVFNFRSSPGLVQIQQVVAQEIEQNTAVVQSQVASTIDGEVAQIWKFATIGSEADVLAVWLSNQLKEGTTQPRDYAILVRQTPDRFEKELGPAFEKRGLRLRNESKKLGRSTLQDLMSEQLTCVVIAFFRLALQKRAPGPWSVATEATERLRAVDPDDTVACNAVSKELTAFIRSSKSKLKGAVSMDTLNELFGDILNFTDIAAWKRAYPAYHTGAGLEIAIEAFRLHLEAVSESCLEPTEWVDTFEGVGQVPLMTVHKSKGLEYHTVLFVGLDDDAWWAHSPGNPDGLATFFVALSRAKQRAHFIFCEERGRREKVAEFYQLLRKAGVREVTPSLKKRS